MVAVCERPPVVRDHRPPAAATMLARSRVAIPLTSQIEKPTELTADINQIVFGGCARARTSATSPSSAGSRHETWSTRLR